MNCENGYVIINDKCIKCWGKYIRTGGICTNYKAEFAVQCWYKTTGTVNTRKWTHKETFPFVNSKMVRSEYTISTDVWTIKLSAKYVEADKKDWIFAELTSGDRAFVVMQLSTETIPDFVHRAIAHFRRILNNGLMLL